MKVIKNPATVEDKDLKRAYELALRFLEDEGYKIQKIKMGISPFAPTYEKVMIIHVFPLIKDVIERVNLEHKLQRKIGRKVGVVVI